MKNTDEAKKVQKINGAMYYAVYERIMPKIDSVDDLLKVLHNEEEENNNN
jgi:hypothetical protein